MCFTGLTYNFGYYLGNIELLMLNSKVLYFQKNTGKKINFVVQKKKQQLKLKIFEAQ